MAGGGPVSKKAEEEVEMKREDGGAGTEEVGGEGGGGGGEVEGKRRKKGGGKTKGEGEEAAKEGVKSGGEEDEEEEPPAPSSSTTSSEEATAANATPTSTAALVVKQMPSSSRAMRNMAEKMRRDKLNTYISELANLVPMVSSSPRRLDKTSVLRLSATFLRMHRTLIPADSSLRTFLPETLKDFNLSEKVLEDMDGFLLVAMASGKIVFVSQHVERLLGHTQNDLLGQSLYGITHAEDHKILSSNLSLEGEAVKEETDAVNDLMASDSKCCPGPSTERDQSLTSGDEACSSSSSGSNRRLSFFIRLSQRAAGRGEAAGYELVHIVGHLRTASTEETQSALTGKAEVNHPQSSSSASPLGEAVMVAVARICLTAETEREKTPILELSLMEACKDEYLTRHGINGEILNCDHRISVVAGYMVDEVKGQSAFSFMHDQDARWTFLALQKMFSSSEGFGNSCYRLKSKTGQYVYLRTHGYCEFDRVSRKFDTFVCVNSLVSEEEGKKAVEEMRQRYSALIADCSTGANALLDWTPTEASTSKAIKAPEDDMMDIALTSPSHPIVSTGVVQPSLSSKANQPVHSMGTHSTELVVYEPTSEENITLTPKSYSSTSSPPPLIPISFPSSSSPPYVYDSSLPIEATRPSPFTTSKSISRVTSDRKFCPLRESTCLPGINSLKRPPSTSPPHTRHSKRLQQSSQVIAPNVVETVVQGCASAPWPQLDCTPVLESSHPGAALQMSIPEVVPESRLLMPAGVVNVTRREGVGGYDSQQLGVEGIDHVRSTTFPEEESRLPRWICNDVRPVTFDLSSIDRNSDFPDLREDVEQLEILSMEVESSGLADPRRWDLTGLHQQLQDAGGGIGLQDNMIASMDEQVVEDTIHGGIRRSHRRLRLRLDSQGRTMASIERELSGLAAGHAIGGDLARLKVEQKKQMHMLHTLQQEHRSSISNQEKSKAFGMQNVGV